MCVHDIRHHAKNISVYITEAAAAVPAAAADCRSEFTRLNVIALTIITEEQKRSAALDRLDAPLLVNTKRIYGRAAASTSTDTRYDCGIIILRALKLKN